METLKGRGSLFIDYLVDLKQVYCFILYCIETVDSYSLIETLKSI